MHFLILVNCSSFKHINCCVLFSLGWVLIDRDGRHFGTMLNYLRDEAVPLPETKKETQELLAEAK